jgi:hypothetical protein
MNKNTSWTNRLCCVVLAASTLVVAGSPVFADPPGRSYDRGDRQDRRDDRQDKRDNSKGKRDDRTDKRDDRTDKRDDRYTRNDRPTGRDDRMVWGRRVDPGYDRKVWEKHYAPGDSLPDRYRGGYRNQPRIYYRGKPYVVPHNRERRYRDVVIVRPYGHWYSGYGHYRRDDDAYKWLAFTAITLGILNYLNEAQQREHEAAQIAATTAPIGERIIWEEGGARGSVVATREGTTSSGRYCREFQQDVSIGGRNEEAYGTACRNPDGSWEVIDADSQ